MKSLLLTLFIFLVLISYAQNVTIPDANFKGYLVGEPAINTNGDSEIQLSEAAAFSGGISCDDMNISDLTGIEEFTALTSLDCSNNTPQATLLMDVSQNTALTTLKCRGNMLISLDVSNNTALTTLGCEWNYLTSLDVSQNTALTDLWCKYNQLSSLDVSQNTALTTLICHNNPTMTSLDVSNNTALTGLYCGTNSITFLDVSNNTALTSLGCASNNLTSLNVSNNAALIWLDCKYNQLECLNIKNGNNVNLIFVISYFSAFGNYNLACIEVDDEVWAAANLTDIEPTSSFSTNCANACSTSGVGFEELTNGTVELVKIVDLMGRETKFKPNTPLIYIYSDGSTERVFKTEE